jgi:hypothetical protein
MLIKPGSSKGENTKTKGISALAGRSGNAMLPVLNGSHAAMPPTAQAANITSGSTPVSTRAGTAPWGCHWLGAGAAAQQVQHSPVITNPTSPGRDDDLARLRHRIGDRAA